MRGPTRADIAAMVDHTLLRTDATHAEVMALVAEATELGVFSVCVSPSMLPVPGLPEGLALATVCGFPSGKHTASAKAAEAAESTALGADEIDMVIDIGLLKGGRHRDLVNEIRMVRQESTLLKVIIESAALTDDEIVAACEAALEAGADFVKTSTGFHPAGGASVEAVRLMAATVGDRLGVKASGGIRTYEQAAAMIAAGATRLGLSGTAAILAEAPA
ncbi:MAG TPA: deoxyribose-phosphate aldolase [Propionibacteriaceae bacterium]|nr:deoxyribose-phosphate aldolase [Propionibacteriaceae bacterium]HPZ48644.1 deoxyribose-phosphate aldolase [Propionibacteriaceae bacterium]HQE31198.1 deoxyribose-phosphate aldolase [Propionibacteriaceae bacterium]